MGSVLEQTLSLFQGYIFLQNKVKKMALLRVGGETVHLVLGSLHLGQLGTFGACGSYSPVCWGEETPGALGS